MGSFEVCWAEVAVAGEKSRVVRPTSHVEGGYAYGV